MPALEALVWVLVGLGSLVLLGAIAFIITLLWIASVGLRRMRDDENAEAGR